MKAKGRSTKQKKKIKQTQLTSFKIGGTDERPKFSAKSTLNNLVAQLE